MKKKALKKMLAGVSAVAMLGSALPMTLIADAYSYNNLPSLSTGFGSLFDYIDEQEGDLNSSISKSPTNASDAVNSSFAGNIVKGATFDLATYTYKLKQYEKTTTTIATDATVVGAPNYYATAWNTDAARTDLLKQLKDKDVTDVTFKADGTIDTITINMPKVKDGAGASDAENVTYAPITFTVVRTAGELTAAYTNKSPSVEVNIILANDITAATLNDVQTTHLNNNVNLNLNGKTLATNYGYQVNNKKLRVWNGTLVVDTPDSNTDSTADIANTTASVLTTYGTATIELYDNVTVSRVSTNGSGTALGTSLAAASAISGQGTLVFAGEANISTTAPTKGAIDIATVNLGDYNMFSDSIGGTAIAEENLKATATKTVISGKKHVYNADGIEVTDRGVETAVSDVSTKYLDADLRTPTVKEYAYQPVTQAAGVNNGNIPLSTDSAIASISNIGQLYWLSQYIAKKPDLVSLAKADTNNDLTINITDELDFSKWTKDPFTPIDASNFKVIFNGNKHTISGMNIVAETGNAAIFSKTKNLGQTSDASKNIFKEIALVDIKSTAKEDGGLVSTLVAEGNNVNIYQSYVINPTLTGTDKGAFASKLDNKSTMSQTYAASKYDMVFFVSDETTQNTLLTKNADGTTALTATGKTNYYVKDFTGIDPEGHGPTYFNNELTADDFKSGKAAFLLNKHVINEVTNVVEITPSYTTTSNIGDGVNTGTYNYDSDVFGQKFPTDNYPVFKDGTTNVVYREIIQNCKGENEQWAADVATFVNTQITPSGDHEDGNGTGICSVCENAYLIEKIFDPCFHKQLKELSTYTKGWVRKAEPNGAAGAAGVNVKGMTEINVDLQKDQTVESFLKAIHETADAKKPKGWLYIVGLTSANPDYAQASITNVNFQVKDSVACRLVAADDTPDEYAERGAFKIATNVTTGTYTRAEAAVATAGSGKDIDPIRELTNASAKDVYVVADCNTTSDDTSPLDRYVSKPTATFKRGTITFKITFLGGVKHNTANDKTGGAWNLSATTANKTDKKLSAAEANEAAPVYVRNNANGTHSYAGTFCDCALATEDCKATYAILNNKQHQGKCETCGAGQLEYKTDAAYATGGKADTHHFEAMFTSGEFTVKRCRECGYVTFSKETSIFVGTPELVKLTEGDATYRQKYSFDIAAGDNTIVSYGVLYTKDGTPIDPTKVALSASGKYFNATGEAVSSELGDVQYSSRKSIKTNGTYTASITLDDPDADVNICGYVIYQKSDSSYDIAKTDVVTKNFRELAIAEIENACSISYEGSAVEGTSRKHKFFIDAEEDFDITCFGVIHSKTGAVLADTELADVNNDTIKKTTKTAKTKSILYSPSFAAATTTYNFRGYMTIDYKGITHHIYTERRTNS